jgi:hypothetical protein
MIPFPPPPSSYQERMKAFRANRPLIPPEELRRFAGRFVAYRWDGAVILAGAPDRESLDRALAEAEIDSQAVVFGYVPGPEDDTYLGVLELE